MSTSPSRTTYIWSPGSPSLKTVSPALKGMKNSEFRKRWLSCMVMTLRLTMTGFKSDFGVNNQRTERFGLPGQYQCYSRAMTRVIPTLHVQAEERFSLVGCESETPTATRQRKSNDKRKVR